MKPVALIPARGGSKGIPRKNLMNFAGLPLMAWSIKQAIAAGLPPFVSTEDEEIARCAVEFGATPITRPRELAQDRSDMAGVLRHAISQVPGDTIVLLQPTNPLRTPDDIKMALSLYEAEKAVYLATVYAKVQMPWLSRSTPMYGVGKNPRRQDIAPTIVETGLIYIYDEKYEPLGFGRTMPGNRVSLEVMQWQALEIDKPEDIKPCEALMRAMIMDRGA